MNRRRLIIITTIISTFCILCGFEISDIVLLRKGTDGALATDNFLNALTGELKIDTTLACMDNIYNGSNVWIMFLSCVKYEQIDLILSNNITKYINLFPMRELSKNYITTLNNFCIFNIYHVERTLMIICTTENIYDVIDINFKSGQVEYGTRANKISVKDFIGRSIVRN